MRSRQKADRLVLWPGGDKVRDLASEAGMAMSYVVITDRAA
jgi:hypothetical protein